VCPPSGGQFRSLFSQGSGALISVFFPAGCRVCNKLLTTASRVPICGECLGSFVRVPALAYEVCGRPLATFGTAPHRPLLCPACRDKTCVFERARSFALSEGALVKAILLLKFEQIQPLGDWFAERLREVLDREKQVLGPDLVVPAPLHRQREKERGYNQAALISKPLAKKLRLTHRAVLLVRTRPRPDKHILSLEERWESVRGAFATCPGSQVDNQRVLLVDDVLTTGASLDACSRALREAGAKSVVGLTVARAVRSPVPSPAEW
jgi:ComF family protein